MPTHFSRQEPKVFSCFNDHEVRDLCALMMELISQIMADVDIYRDEFLHTLRFPEQVFHKMHAFREAYDRFLKEVIDRSSLSVSCKKGCSACCHVVPCGLEPLEVMEIYERIRKWHDFKNIIRSSAKAIGAFQKILREVEQANNKHVKNSSKVYPLALSNYSMLRIPCIFLDKDLGTCRIYDIRPLICRAVFSLSDPAFCDPDHPDFQARLIEVIEPVDEINLVLMQTNLAISESLGFRFPEIMQHALCAWDRWVQKGPGI